jgi:hypothetical protein
MERILVHIDSLVLKGFRYEDRHAIAAALQNELARMLTATGSARHVAALGNPARVRAGDIRVASSATARQVGAAVARHIGGALKL